MIALPTRKVILNLVSGDSMVASVVERYQSHTPIKIVIPKSVL